QAQAVHDPRDTLRHEQSHEVVFERHIELRCTRITLTSRTSAKLTVNAARLVTFRTDNGKTSGGPRFRSQLDVCTTTRHVRRYRYGTRFTRFSNNFCFALVLLCVQHLVLDLFHLEHPADQLGNFHRGCTDEYRATLVGQSLNLLDNGCEFFTNRLVYQIVVILTDHRLVRGDHHHVQLVDVPELRSFRLRGTGHTSELVIHPEVVLQGDGGICLRSILHLHVLFRFDRLVQTIGIPPAFHDTAGLLIDDLYLAVDNDV